MFFWVSWLAAPPWRGKGVVSAAGLDATIHRLLSREDVEQWRPETLEALLVPMLVPMLRYSPSACLVGPGNTWKYCKWNPYDGVAIGLTWLITIDYISWPRCPCSSFRPTIFKFSTSCDVPGTWVKSATSCIPWGKGPHASQPLPLGLRCWCGKMLMRKWWDQHVRPLDLQIVNHVHACKTWKCSKRKHVVHSGCICHALTLVICTWHPPFTLHRQTVGQLVAAPSLSTLNMDPIGSESGASTFFSRNVFHTIIFCQQLQCFHFKI